MEAKKIKIVIRPFLVLTLIFFGQPSLIVAQYAIILKDGTVYEASYYWRDGDKISFWDQEGEKSVDKNQVLNILQEKHEIVPLDEPTQQRSTDKKERYQTESRRSSSRNPVSQIPKSRVSMDLKRKLSQDYPDSYSLQLLLYKKNMESYDYLSSLQTSSVSDRILSKLISQYYPHFSLIKLLFEKNVEAYRKLQQ